MKPTISYILESCKGCLKCLRACPVGAISINKGVVHIQSDKCIDCDACLKSCNNRGLKVQSEHMEDSFGNYDYKVALVSSSIYSNFASRKEAVEVMNALKTLGFDEVVDYSDIEGAIYQKSVQMVEESDEPCRITSFCPSVNKLIKKNFPMLVERLLPLEYPVEVAAKLVRQKYAGKNVGIYSVCECVAKMTLAKEPFGNKESNIDHALSISHLFPKINSNRKNKEGEISLCRDGILSVVSDFYKFGQATKPVVAIDGLSHVKEALEEAEFDQLDDIGLLALFACYNGCIGGHFLWSNPFVGEINIDRMVVYANKENATLLEKDIYKDFEDDEVIHLSRKERLARFKKINEALEKLPGFDCGACGYPNCRTLAEEYIDGKGSLEDCRIKEVRR